MNYYPWHIGDYLAHTAHLSVIEDCAYRRLLDSYYLTEKALPLDFSACARLIRMREHVAEVECVLREFFTETPGGWAQARCEREIAIYRSKKANHWAAALTKAQRAEMAGERRATKVSATPNWLTKEDRYAIASVYGRAATLTAQTGEKHEVDHIVPLRSKVVCGLHVPWNLTVMLAYKNRAKSNSFEVS